MTNNNHVQTSYYDHMCFALPTLSSAQKEYKHLAGRAEIDEPAMIWGPGARFLNAVSTLKSKSVVPTVSGT